MNDIVTAGHLYAAAPENVRRLGVSLRIPDADGMPLRELVVAVCAVLDAEERGLPHPFEPKRRPRRRKRRQSAVA